VLLTVVDSLQVKLPVPEQMRLTQPVLTSVCITRCIAPLDRLTWVALPHRELNPSATREVSQTLFAG